MVEEATKAVEIKTPDVELLITQAPEPNKFKYSCCKCRKLLFTDATLESAHLSDVKPFMGNQKEKKTGKKLCTSYFIEYMEWIGSTTENSDKILCPNAKCRNKLGTYFLSGMQCSCGCWMAPAYQIHKKWYIQIYTFIFLFIGAIALINSPQQLVDAVQLDHIIPQYPF